MKNILTTILLVLILSQPSFSAGSSSDGGDSATDYEKAVKLINQAKKYETKGKTETENDDSIDEENELFDPNPTTT